MLSETKTNGTLPDEPQPTKIGRDAALAAIEEERNNRIKLGGERINEILKELRLSLVPRVEIVGNQIRADVIIASAD